MKLIQFAGLYGFGEEIANEDASGLSVPSPTAWAMAQDGLPQTKLLADSDELDAVGILRVGNLIQGILTWDTFEHLQVIE